MAPLSRGHYNTLSAALLGLAFDAYASEIPGDRVAKFSASQSAGGGKSEPLKLDGQVILRGVYGGDARSLHLQNDTGVPGYFAVTNAGFDRTPPNAVVRDGMEILREYLDAQGQPVTSVKTGEEITVRLRLRAIDADYIPNVALTDLLPGGFELALPSRPAQTTDAGADAHTEPGAAPLDRLGTGGGWAPDFVDVREDRVVLYGTLSKNLAQYTYRIRATNAGLFLVPPSYAESMYDRTLRARALAGSVTVENPERPKAER